VDVLTVFLWVFATVLVAAVVYLNVMSTRIIRISQLHDARKKKQFIILVWALPVVGVFVVMMQINRDIKKNQKKVEEEIAPAIRQLADQLKVLEADIQQEQQKKNKYH
jgi:NADH:ubiquinone oxidoreductase subunit 6 (subunit J)